MSTSADSGPTPEVAAGLKAVETRLRAAIGSKMGGDIDARLSSVVKSFATYGASPAGNLAGDETPASAVIPVSGGRQMDAINAFVGCRFDIEGLSNIAEQSNGMRRIRDAMAVNLHGSGFRIEEKVRLSEPDSDQKIRDQIFIEKAWRADMGEQLDLLVTDQEVAERRKQLEMAMPLELARISSFFASACLSQSFSSLCQISAYDKEGCGNAGWEVIRRPSETRHNPRGALARLNYVPGHTIRLRRLDDFETPVMVREPVGTMAAHEVFEGRRFRSYGHYVRGEVRFFKEFGDPRMISQTTGEALKTPCWRCVGGNVTDPATGAARPCILCQATGFINPKARDRQAGEPLANELIHWKIETPLEEYGLPRWVGVFYETVGSIESSYLNWRWFKRGMFNALMILAWGMNVEQSVLDKLEADIQKLLGSENQGGVLCVEGQPAAGADATRMHMEIKPLTQDRGDDALYQKYDANNRQKLAECWRIPEMLLGQVKNTNRATAIVELQMAEQQIFGPIRRDFDHVINYVLFPEMGVKYHNFVSNGPTLTDPDQLARTIDLLARSGLLQIAEGRKYLAPVVGEKLAKIEGEWQYEPLQLFLAKLQNMGNFLKAGYSPEQALRAVNGEDVGPPNTAPAAPDAPAAPAGDMTQKSRTPLPNFSLRAAGLAVRAEDTGRVLMLQRALCEDDHAAGMWEFPGGCLDEGEAPLKAAIREFEEETGIKKPRGKLAGSWVSPNGVYQGFLLDVKSESDVPINPGAKRVLNPDDPDQDNVEVVAWWKVDDLLSMSALRPEVRTGTDWNLFRSSP